MATRSPLLCAGYWDMFPLDFLNYQYHTELYCYNALAPPVFITPSSLGKFYRTLS